ncbi:nucleotidyltransferase domain-containing protein [Fredinandcohnia sp. 179-A 10B2 NHS]|uniref:nucleotidyltransferase domain-containing protein n=1 Tax=Fredinandcohnia sp. 179-A 10B2 NHS TaxID=3235176 RepID=UPI0039A069CC
MSTNGRKPIETAHLLIQERFPDCQGAILAGSVIRGEATNTSDLDILIFDNQLKSSFRESFYFSNWPVELFAHNLVSYKGYFISDYKRARPSLPRMIAEGIVLKDQGIIQSIKTEANLLLERGPEAWSQKIIDTKRYFITDALDDFIGSQNRAEELFIANTLAELVSEFVLRTNRQWIGTSKWIVRSLKQYDPLFAEKFVYGFDTYYQNGEKELVIKLVDQVLEPYGGRFFEGFTIGKDKGE